MNKSSHHERPSTRYGIGSSSDPFACQSPCLWHGGRSSAACYSCRLFDVNCLLFLSIFAIKLLNGWDTCRIKGTRIGGRIRPSTGLAKHHWKRIDRRDSRNESWIGNLAVPVFALEWDIISRAIN